LGACAPSIRIEAEFPATTVFTVRPQSSGVLLFVRVPASRPSGGIHVERSRGRTFHIPPGHYPPPGQCRVWNPDLPPGRQSKPGPCHRLERRVPPGSILIYGRVPTGPRTSSRRLTPSKENCIRSSRAPALVTSPQRLSVRSRVTSESTRLNEAAWGRATMGKSNTFEVTSPTTVLS